jgi:histidinol-phosphate aminotransferase
MIATLGPGRTVAIPQPTFTLYTLMAGAMGATITPVPLTDTLGFDVPRLIEAAGVADVLILCSPNNPTGSLLLLKDLEKVLLAARGLVIVDEAYHEFSGQTALPLLRRFRNLIVLRTFSKAMGLAGLRFGYMMAPVDLTREIAKVKLPYNVNVFTLTAAEVLMDAAYAMEGSIRALVVERQRLIEELAEVEGVEPFPSHANFVLFRTPHPADIVFQKLYEEGVLIRNVSHYPMLERGLRVTVGTSDQNRRFLEKLELVLQRIVEGV